MEDSALAHLPPLTELIPTIDFPVYGLASPYLQLKLGGLHYGVEEQDGKIIGLMLCYGLRYRGSSRILIVESSVVPASVPREDAAARIEWSLSSIFQLRECLNRLHSLEPRRWIEDEELDRQYQTGVRELRSLQWASFTETQGIQRPLAGLEVTRDRAGLILARRFTGNNMLLIASLGIQPKHFIEALNLLVPLQDAFQAVERHQEEFELLTQEG